VSELRWDPLKKNWIIMAHEKGRIPRDFFRERKPRILSVCPFCYGKEEKTSPEVFVVRPESSPADTPGWQVRVIPNKYPVLNAEGRPDERSRGLFRSMEGVGVHEIIIETPDHERGLADLSPGEIVNVLFAYRARMLALRGDDRLRYVLLFKNYGEEAGEGISHSHSQLIAVPVVPPVTAAEIEACREFHESEGDCLLCAMLRQERAEGERIILENEHFIAFAPYASGFPFEMRIFPLVHCHDFSRITDQEMASLASALKDVLQRLKKLLRDPSYNFILHTAPPPPQAEENANGLPGCYHWHLEMIPRLTKITGLEWGSGFQVNPMPPEPAAAFLREVNISALDEPFDIIYRFSQE